MFIDIPANTSTNSSTSTTTSRDLVSEILSDMIGTIYTHQGVDDVEAYLITAYNDFMYGLFDAGDRFALYIHIKSKLPFLYDPGGFYLSGKRGSGAFFEGREANIETNVKYRSQISIRVIKTKITLTTQQASNIIDKAMEQGEWGYLTCAKHISDVLKDDYGNKNDIRLPGNLQEEVEKIERTKK